MGAGKYDQRVRIERAVETADGYGGTSTVWTAVSTVWASVKARSGREHLQAQAVTATKMYIVKMRRYAGLDETHRLVWIDAGAAILNIRAVLDNGPRAAEMEIMAELGVAPDG